MGCAAGLALLSATPAFAQSGTVIGSIAIEQIGPSPALGTWTLLQPDQTSIKMSTKTYTAEVTLPGNYTLFVEPPEGMSAKVYLYKGTELVKTLDRPQISFVLAEGDAYRISVNYILSRTGDVSINSYPSGIPFRLEGPNKITVNDKTPYALEGTPEGQYTVRYYPKGCVEPRPKSLLLQKDGRLAFTINLSCETLVIDETSASKKEVSEEEKTVTVGAGDGAINFTDVPQQAWFAPYVFTVVKTGIVSGYKNEYGQPMGKFGPENLVTVGELAKMAHELAGIDENDITARPENRMAIGEWFSSYVASAEQLFWLLFQDTSLDLQRPATRGEVLVTLYQALDIPIFWPHGDVFTDVSVRTPYGGAIEKAAEDGIVSGAAGTDGESTGMFHPLENINRAEMAKILSLMIDTYKAN
ncbi:hypothetical protein A2706_05285 [Candidatus Peribacteria bacterium RIFCSPHIGHO2_01_FULL_51_35]|nr:MAG: hypothetical protein A2706_05285 [Candidatus Peribacteria bacterium RIFCSPHIGHO2_01_FULL_51_35]